MGEKVIKRAKIRLSGGVSSAEFLEVLEGWDYDEVLLSLPSDVPLLTQITFLSQLQRILEEKKMKIVFLTRKKYYQEWLTKKGFEVVEKTPEVFESLKLEKWLECRSKIEASPNQGREEKPDMKFEPKIGKSHPSFTTSLISAGKAKSGRPLRGIYFFLVLLLLLFLGGFWIWISPHATITIKPQISVVPITQNIILKLPDPRIPDEESNLPQVQAIYTKTSIEGRETFPALDRSYEVTNAYGEVTLFNTTGEPKFLLPSRLATEEGYIFRFDKEVTIPPSTADGPGTIIVKIVADEFTEDDKPIGGLGNIDAGTELFFPALRKETRELYYAKANRGPLVGGSTLTRYFLGAEDIEKAKPILIDTFETRAKEMLEQELLQRSGREKKEYLLIDHPDLLIGELTEFTGPIDKVGNEQETFEVSGKLMLKGVVFSRDDILEILKQKIESTQDHRKKLLEIDRTSFEYRILNTEGMEDGNWIKLSVSVMGVEAIDFNADNYFAKEWRENLIKDLAGKSVSMAKSILTNHPEIEQVVDIDISPFWLKQLPTLYDQIELKVQN
ncbi:MAG TPA: hypothetical protein VIT68_02385 [Candidatus Gracilibacteria bacterium]